MCFNAAPSFIFSTLSTCLSSVLTLRNPPLLTPSPHPYQGWRGDLCQATAPEARRWGEDDGNAKRGSRVRRLLPCTPPLPPTVLFLSVLHDLFFLFSVLHPFYLFLHDHLVSLHKNTTGYLFMSFQCRITLNSDVNSVLVCSLMCKFILCQILCVFTPFYGLCLFIFPSGVCKF